MTSFQKLMQRDLSLLQYSVLKNINPRYKSGFYNFLQDNSALQSATKYNKIHRSKMELTCEGKSYKLIVLSSSDFNSAKDLIEGGTKYVIDCRAVKPKEIVNKLQSFCELIYETTVSYVWLNCPFNRFLEIKGRLRSILAKDKDFTKVTSDLLLLKLTTHGQEVSEDKALKISNDVLNFGQNLLDIHRLLDAHPGLLHEKFHLSQSLKRKRQDHIESAPSSDYPKVASMSYSDTRRPNRRVFKALKQMIKDPPRNATRCTRCYMCNTTEGSFAILCDGCHELNEEMKRASCDLHGRYAIVTGGRIKIGLETSLKLLRDGASVIATTRFPVDAAKRFSQENDFHMWKHRLKIVYLELQSMASIDEFLLYVQRNIPHLDILINNAAQTIFRSYEYYQPLIAEEANRLPCLAKDARNLLVNTSMEKLEVRYKSAFSSQPAALTWPANSKEFRDDQKDDHGEPLDLRLRNSWTYNLDEVPLQELLQVLTINSVGPFILTSRLKPLLKQSPFSRKFVVNVSAMEGQFSRLSKGHRHPHTNMAKASLNMMTRTSGLELQMDGIYMTAVDTGWITDERPFHQARHEADVKGFVVPLDCKDGAARVCHPIVHGLNPANTPYFAVFLKDFRSQNW